jgi:hypothetical protein
MNHRLPPKSSPQPAMNLIKRSNAMPPRKPDKKPYAGILAEPMPKYTALSPPADGEIDALIDAKMKALFGHYRLDSTDAFGGGSKIAAAWANLAWHLVLQHVPGFVGTLRGRGRPATRKQDDVTIVMHVELLKRRDGLSERKAIKCIAGDNLVAGTEAALLKRYKNAKPTFAPMARMFDNMVAAIGHDAFVQTMEESFSGDGKDTFLSPE